MLLPIGTLITSPAFIVMKAGNEFKDKSTAINQQRYLESLKNLMLVAVYLGRGQSILAKRERIWKRTIAKCRLHYQRHAA